MDIHGPVNDTRPYLLMSDIYFLLSKGEGFPLGLLEAMSCGLPTIVSDSPPFEEIINAGKNYSFIAQWNFRSKH